MSDDGVREDGKVEMKVRVRGMEEEMRNWYLKRVYREEKKKETC